MKMFGLLAMGVLAFAFVPVQHGHLVHGFVIGAKPNITEVIQAGKLENFMGRRTRVATAVKGRVLRVTKAKGGWFDMDAGKGRVISAHFKDYRVNLPSSITGRTVVADGIIQKPVNPSAQQHYAGDDHTHRGTTSSNRSTAQSQQLTLEVRGLVVD